MEVRENPSKLSPVIASVIIIVVALFAVKFLFDAIYTSRKWEYLNSLPNDAVIEFTVSSSWSVWKNEHVGNEWTVNSTVNGYTLKPDTTYSTLRDHDIYISTECIENDDMPDTSKKRTQIKFSNYTLSAPIVRTVDISVKENGGRYKGNHAILSVEYTINPLIDYLDVINYAVWGTIPDKK